MSDDLKAKKAAYFDMTVRALDAEIAREREAMGNSARKAVELAESDVLFPYSDNTLHDAHQRSVRIGTMSGILDMMTRGLRDRDGETMA